MRERHAKNLLESAFNELAKKYFRQMINGMAHCHEKNICHRDLKL